VSLHIWLKGIKTFFLDISTLDNETTTVSRKVGNKISYDTLNIPEELIRYHTAARI